MIELLLYTAAVAMTVIAVWRFPSALWGDPRRRALWGCYAGFAAALWLKTESIRRAVNASPITDLGVLLKHYASIAAILSILSYIVAIYGKPDGSEDVPRHVAVARYVSRIANKAAFGALLLMTVLFFTVVDRSKPSDRFIADHAGQWGAMTYESVFYVFLGCASAVCAYQWTSQTRRADNPWLRTGLGLMSVAMWMGVLYVTSRTTFMWISVIHPPSVTFADTFELITELLQDFLFLLFATGATIPAGAALRRRMYAWRALNRLYPLWRDLTEAFPEISMTAPRGHLWELTPFGMPLEIRLDRWVADIGDAIDKVRYHVPGGLLAAAHDAAGRGRPAGAAADAYWIKAAVHLKNAGAPLGAPADCPTNPASDRKQEVAWLLDVQAVYTSLTDDQLRPLLNTVEQPL